MLSPCHHSFVNDLGRIVSPGINMDTFFHHRIGTGSQCFSGLVSTGLDLRGLWKPAWGSRLRGHEISSDEIVDFKEADGDDMRKAPSREVGQLRPS